MTDTASALQRVKPPAICLVVLGGLGILNALAGMVMAVVGGGMNADFLQQMQEQGQQIPPWLAPMLGGGSTVVNVITSAIGLGLAGFIAFSGLQMMKLKSHGLCMAGAVVAMLPCSVCCCLGLPLGIWSVVVLNKPDVRAAFDAPSS